MPTAAKMTAALCLGVVGYLLSKLVMPLMPESTDFGNFVPTNIVIGGLVGWLVTGPRAGGGLWSGVSNGLTGAFILILWGVAAQSVVEMIKLAMRMRYKGLFDALVSSFGIGAEYFLIVATVPFVSTAIIGGAISGIITNFIGKRWP